MAPQPRAESRPPASPARPVPDGSGATGRWRGRAGVLAEWAVWLTLALAFWLQTARFDEEIASYRFGATGWPRALAVAVAIGATGQMLYRLMLQPAPRDATYGERTSLGTLVQRGLIFLMPLVWLWTIPYAGFYVATPVFIVALLLVLEVRSLPALLGVTAVVYGLVLLIFTRLFYVGLPVGTLDGFYEANTWIIGTVRTGV